MGVGPQLYDRILNPGSASDGTLIGIHLNIDWSPDDLSFEIRWKLSRSRWPIAMFVGAMFAAAFIKRRR